MNEPTAANERGSGNAAPLRRTQPVQITPPADARPGWTYFSDGWSQPDSWRADDPACRKRAAGRLLYFERSDDGGSTWSLIGWRTMTPTEWRAYIAHLDAHGHI